ncbi:uncharacterized protein K452DRAFT_131239 [Aplosporella prunicola CBS 121167]|uniref:Uncharacterized protein n=1 Tax=Aplosporella prunicola CBS 121167 TaxID=1176127 RepID=A0A6A6BN64_9PEZI|nr:uncharacterized protein K452DRAFT_131239 [Aplosporella prunicola CBS 121167]KAF2144853.1 hypothetical protein K452DRAFT_131239 [Aplosporella prunicola CBS 121167]
MWPDLSILEFGAQAPRTKRYGRTSRVILAERPRLGSGSCKRARSVWRATVIGCSIIPALVQKTKVSILDLGGLENGLFISCAVRPVRDVPALCETRPCRFHLRR